LFLQLKYETPPVASYEQQSLCDSQGSLVLLQCLGSAPSCTDSDFLDSELLDSELLDSELLDSELLDSELLDSELLDSELLDSELSDSELSDFELSDSELLDSELLDSELSDSELGTEMVFEAAMFSNNPKTTRNFSILSCVDVWTEDLSW